MVKIETGMFPVWDGSEGVGAVSVTNDTVNIRHQLHHRIVVRGFSGKGASTAFERLEPLKNRLGVPRIGIESLISSAICAAETQVRRAVKR